MPKYKNTNTGHVVDRPEHYIAVFGDGHYVRVDDDMPVYVEPCCGAQLDDYEDDLDFDDPVETDEKENDNA